MRRVRIGALNLPSGVKKQKARLLRGDARYHKAFSILDDNEVEIVAIPEASNWMVDAIDGKVWGVSLATANSKIGHRKLGNALAWRRDRWYLTELEELDVSWSGRRTGLHMPWGLFECRETGVEIIVLAVHLPTKRDASRADRRRIRREVCAFAKELFSVYGVPVVVAGDMNDRLGYRGLKKAVRHGVDAIFSVGLQSGWGRAVVKGVKGVVSDHPLVYFLAKIPTT